MDEEDRRLLMDLNKGIGRIEQGQTDLKENLTSYIKAVSSNQKADSARLDKKIDDHVGENLTAHGFGTVVKFSQWAAAAVIGIPSLVGVAIWLKNLLKF